MNGRLPTLSLIKPDPFAPSRVDTDLIGTLAGRIAVEEPQFLRALVRMGREAEHIGYQRGMSDCARIREQARAVAGIADDPARVAPPDELWSDFPLPPVEVYEDEPCQDESGFNVAGSGATP